MSGKSFSLLVILFGWRVCRFISNMGLFFCVFRRWIYRASLITVAEAVLMDVEGGACQFTPGVSSTFSLGQVISKMLIKFLSALWWSGERREKVLFLIRARMRDCAARSIAGSCNKLGFFVCVGKNFTDWAILYPLVSGIQNL